MYLAAPVVPQLVTYVNETDPLSLDCSKVVTATEAALDSASWQNPNGITDSMMSTVTYSPISRTAAGNYSCVTVLLPNANGVTTVTGTTLVVVYCECPPYWRNMFPYVPLVPTDPPTVLSPQPTVYMAQGRTIQLNCTFDGLPAPNVIWTHPNGSVITSQSRFTIQTTSTSSSLTITSLVGGGDNGTYICRASNFRGVSSNTVQLFVQGEWWVGLHCGRGRMLTWIGIVVLSGHTSFMAYIHVGC